MKLIVGLGNPGKQYEKTRHNAGFLLVDQWVDQQNFKLFSGSKTYKAERTEGVFRDQKVIVLKPQTYMNLSGESVSVVAHFFKIAPADILVIHDEIDFDFARNELKFGGSHAGHNGLKSIIAHLGTKDFWRLRIGVGRPENAHYSVADYVLSAFHSDELQTFQAEQQRLFGFIEKFIVS
ncbi:MAG TPA: aminoacyl-tRNA hydrolase [Candidatus Absconditabacterales bacterium]|nr:aminoacyl-tRNA hydrolase [Candidatus Absconditabacterales bacterium]HMT27113.1 aminoacyl-tRNA hydrolase [Candidatus Absconditabacterales bacterium]